MMLLSNLKNISICFSKSLSATNLVCEPPPQVVLHSDIGPQSDQPPSKNKNEDENADKPNKSDANYNEIRIHK